VSKIKRIILLSLLIGLLWGSFSISVAQNEVRVESLTVSLLPQFNDQRLLIIYEAALEAPGSAVLAIPSAVELEAALYRADDRKLSEIEAEFEGASDGGFIRFTSPAANARLELYQDVIPRQAEHFVDFTLPAQRYDLVSLHWLATFPLDASNFVTNPPMKPFCQQVDASQTIEWYRESDEPSFVVTEESPSEGTNLTVTYIGLAVVFLMRFGLMLHGVWRLRTEEGSSGICSQFFNLSFRGTRNLSFLQAQRFLVPRNDKLRRFLWSLVQL
jgi:hypothetical protein